MELDYDYLVYPDYLEEEVLKREDLDAEDEKFIKILSHNNISKDPILKAESRYAVLIESSLQESLIISKPIKIITGYFLKMTDECLT